MKSRIVSPLAALRAGFDRFLPDDWPGDDESVGGLIRRYGRSNSGAIS